MNISYIESFFYTWSPNQAYILGYFASDGCMYRNNRGSCYISFTSADQELLLLIKQLLKAKNKIEAYQPKGNTKLRYTLQIGSKTVFNRFLELGFTPAKSLTLKYPNIPDKLLAHFVRGYFDGDGCAYFKIAQRKNRNGQIRHLQINIRSGSKSFLESLQEKLSKLADLGRGSLYFHSNAYSLAYSGKNVIKLYSFMYPNLNVPHLVRKRTILEKGINHLGS